MHVVSIILHNASGKKCDLLPSEARGLVGVDADPDGHCTQDRSSS